MIRLYHKRKGMAALCRKPLENEDKVVRHMLGYLVFFVVFPLIRAKEFSLLQFLFIGDAGGAVAG